VAFVLGVPVVAPAALGGTGNPPNRAKGFGGIVVPVGLVEVGAAEEGEVADGAEGEGFGIGEPGAGNEGDMPRGIPPPRPASRNMVDILSTCWSASGLETICLKRSSWSVARTSGPIEASLGSIAIIWSMTPGLDSMEDICCRNCGELSIPCIMLGSLGFKPRSPNGLRPAMAPKPR